MPPGASKKKKRKASKKKKKKQLSNKNNKGEDDRRSEEIGDEDEENEVENEEGACSSAGVALESQSGNDGGENEEDDDDDEDAELSDAVVGDPGTVKGLGNEGSLDHEDDTFLEAKESLEELAKSMEEDEGVNYEPTERVVSASSQVVDHVPTEAIEVLNGNELAKDRMVSSQVEDNKAIESQEVGDEIVPSLVVDNKVSSSDNHPTVETEGTKQDDHTESSQIQANVPCAAPMVQRTTWKCCCGLFEVFTGSNR